MIIVKLQGGLGNQLFQYSFGKKLSILNNCDLKFDCSLFLNNHEIRNIEIENFNVEFKIANKSDIKIANNKNIFQKLGIISKTQYIKQTKLEFDTSIKQKTADNLYVDGYWQTEKYFDDIKVKLIKEFTFKNKLELNDKFKNDIEKIQNSESVSIHIRRGDYIKSEIIKKMFRNIFEDNYYSKAIEIVNNKIINPKYFIFSDDIEWCKNNFNIEKEHVFIDEHKPYEDLYLMSLCKHQITANSTFSWWGAWLNKNQNKVVVSPNKWFYENWSTEDLMPSNWIKV